MAKAIWTNPIVKIFELYQSANIKVSGKYFDHKEE